MLETGARRLGAAFQKVNFLRDLARGRGRPRARLLPGRRSRPSSTSRRSGAILDDIDADLAAAAATLPLLPRGPRRAVALAHGLFADLAERIRRTPAERLRTTRVRVPDPVKVRLAALALIDRLPRKR